MDKILLVYASFGEGHKRAAYSLQQELNAECIDLLDFSYPFIKKLYIFLYITVTEYFPFFWKLLFLCSKNNFMRCFLERLQEFLFFPFFEYLRKTNPKIIVATHFYPFSFIARMKEEMNIKLIAIVTDLKVHPFWANNAVDVYFTALDETKEDLKRIGISTDKIISGYVSVRKSFFEQIDEALLRKKFALNEKPVILFMSSLRGNFPFFSDIMKDVKDKFNIFVIYGRNLKLKKYLESLNFPYLRFFPSYEQIWELFQISSVIITKPGGLTVFEGICKKKPFIFLRYIPGQEEENMKILIKYGIGAFCTDKDSFMSALYHFCNDNSHYDYPLNVSDIRPALVELIKKINNSHRI